MNTKKSSLKNKLTSIVLTGLSLLPTTKLKAQDTNSADYNPATSQRVIELDIANPLATSDSRAKANYSTNQIINYALNESENDSLPLRLAKTAGDLYGAYFTAYIFHEAGHEGADLKFGNGFRGWDLTPKIAPTEKTLDTPDKKATYYSAGLNQNTLNSEKIWENGQRFGNFSDAGLLFNSLYESFYSPNQNTRSNMNTGDDLESYCNALEEKRIHETPRGIKRKSLIANALTFQNYESIYNLFNYAMNGHTNNKPTTFSVGNLEITPPIFNQYLTHNGSYLQGNVFINPQKKNPIKISAGFTDDKIRAGAKVYDVKLSDKFNFSPYTYADTNGGFSVGSDFGYKATKNIELTARVEFNHKDILENDVKDEGNGLNATAGIRLRF